MEGFLHKRGRGKSIAMYKPYARRYFVLDEKTHELAYYTDDSKKTYRGMVNILDSEVIELSKATTGKSFCFEVKCNIGKPHAETITLAAPNDAQQVMWIQHISELGGGGITWLPERVKPSQDPSGTEQEQDDRARKQEHVKTGTLILQSTSSFFPWQFQFCSLSYDFGELSLFTEEGSGGSSSRKVTSTIELSESFILMTKASPQRLAVHAAPSSKGSDNTTTQVEVAGVFQLFYMDTRGKQSYSFAFQTSAACEDWRAAFQACGCSCEEEEQAEGGAGERGGEGTSSGGSGLPPQSPLSPGGYQRSTEDYDMNDIDEDSFHSQQQQQQQQQQSPAYEMNDIDEDSVPPSPSQQQRDNFSTGSSPPSISSEDNTFFYSDDEDMPSTRGGGGGLGTEAPPPSPPLSTRNSSTVHPRAHLFEQINRNGAEAINLTEFMIGLRRREEVAQALQLPSNSRQEDGSRDRCVAVFNAMDDNHSGHIDERKFLQYMNELDAKAHRQQQFVEDPAALFINSSHHDERKEDSLAAATSSNFDSPGSVTGTPPVTPTPTPGSSGGSKSRSNSRSSFYGKIARKIQSETTHKRNVSVAIRSEDIPNCTQGMGKTKDSGRVDKSNDLFMKVDTEDDFLEAFRAKNGMNTESVHVPYGEERKTTDNLQQQQPNSAASSLFGSEVLGGSSRSQDRYGYGAGTEHEHEQQSASLAESLLADLKFIVLEAEHPARGVRTRLRLRELFRNDTTNTIDYSIAQKFFHENNDSNATLTSAPPDLFPHLTKGACTWQDCNRYLRHYEQKVKAPSSDFKIKFEISLPVSGYSCVLTSPVLNWVQKAARKIKTLPLPDMHLLPLQQIMEVIERQHCVDFTNQLTTLCLIEMSGAENYVQFLEDTTQCFEKAPRKTLVPSGKQQDPQDDIDKSFAAADRDNDGTISRKEWRRLMSDREGLVRAANEDKQKLIDENNRLRKALDIDSSEYSRERLQLKETRASNYERYLDVKNEEIAELKVELSIYKRNVHELEREQDRAPGLAAASHAAQQQEPHPQPTSTRSHDDSTLFSLEMEEQQQPMYELPDDQHQHQQPPSPPSPPHSVAMSLSASLPTLSIPDHYSEHEALHQQERRQQYVDRLLTSRVYGQEESTGWARKRLVVPEEERVVPPSLNEISQNTHTHTAPTPDKAVTSLQQQPHPLRQAFIHNTKSLDLTPLTLTSRAIGTHTHTPKNKTPHKSFKDHTTSSRSKKLPEKGTGLFSGVRSPGAWSNSQFHLAE